MRSAQAFIFHQFEKSAMRLYEAQNYWHLSIQFLSFLLFEGMQSTVTEVTDGYGQNSIFWPLEISRRKSIELNIIIFLLITIGL